MHVQKQLPPCQASEDACRNEGATRGVEEMRGSGCRLSDAHMAVLVMLLCRFVFWAYPVTDAIYQEFYDLVRGCGG
jgi:hypothetical protein